MNIALIEAFYTGSHKAWAHGVRENSRYNVELFTLPGRHWKWRMHGAAITLAEQINSSKQDFELIIATDMLDVALFKSLLNPKYQSIPIALYMHENQLTYPWSPEDQDVKLKRDNHYAFTNYTSCLVADRVLFNSDYHRNSFTEALPGFLKMFPDENNLDTVASISQKSQTLYLGLNLSEFTNKKGISHPLRILWNHRWEYDKNPDVFLQVLQALSVRKVEFELVLLGERYSKMPSVFFTIQEQFSNHIVHNGYAESREKYWELLSRCDVLPVTSNQDFFGISIVEAISAGVVPVLPNRLAYPEYVKQENLYTKFDELIDKTMNFKQLSIPDVSGFSWGNMANEYDDLFGSVIRTSSSPKQ